MEKTHRVYKGVMRDEWQLMRSWLMTVFGSGVVTSCKWAFSLDWCPPRVMNSRLMYCVCVCWCVSVYCRKTVVCPIIDVISDDTFEYMAGSDMTYGGFNWKLNFRWYPVPQREMDRRKGDRTLPVRWVVHTARWSFKFHCYYPFHTYKTDWQQFLCFKLSLFILPRDIYDPGLVLT